MRTNIAATTDLSTHEGAPAAPIAAEAMLRRSLLACLLFENEFYEDGEEIAARLARLAKGVSPGIVAALAIEARTKHNLRHAPLFLARELARHASGSIVGDTIAAVIQRADELGEFVALYWKDGRQPLGHQVKRGLGKALAKFDEYQLAKYDRDVAVKLRDVLRLVHPKPAGDEQAALWKRVLDRTLATPDTWEVALSAGADKKATFERLIREHRLGYLALLRNLRNMTGAGVDIGLLREAVIARRGAERVLPFRYVAAARACPQLEPAIDQALSEAIAEMPVLPGRTAVLVDVSGSMNARLSARSDLTRMDAAATLASALAGDMRVFTFSNEVVEVPPRRGMAGVDVVVKSQPAGGTLLFEAVAEVGRRMTYDRMIVITDEQASQSVAMAAQQAAFRSAPSLAARLFGKGAQEPVVAMPEPRGRGYVINVASNRNGVGYGPWTHIDGFSETVLRFIHAHEAGGV